MAGDNDYGEGSPSSIARTAAGQIQQSYQKPGMWDYFKAGAQDFGQDVKDAVSGNMKGPNFSNRQKLFDQDK